MVKIEEVEARQAALFDDQKLKPDEVASVSAGERSKEGSTVDMKKNTLSIGSDGQSSNMGSRQSLGASSTGSNRGTRLPQRTIQKFSNYKAAIGRVRSSTIPNVNRLFKIASVLFVGMHLFQLVNHHSCLVLLSVV